MKQPHSGKLYIILTICTAFIFSFSYFGSSVYGKVFGNDIAFAENSRLGPVSIDNLNKEQVLTALAEEQMNWKKNTAISVKYKEITKNVDLKWFEFENERSLELAKSKSQTLLIVNIKDKNLTSFLDEISSEIAGQGFETDRFRADLISYAAMLKTGTYTIKLQDYITESLKSEIVAESTITVSNMGDSVNRWTSTFPTLEILPHSQFSILKLLEENGLISSFDSETLSIISSAIYKTMLPTNFSISERHLSRLLPEYAEAGFEAKVDPDKNMDLIISNPNDQLFTLEFKYIDNLLNVSLIGSPFLYQYNLSVKDKETFNPKKIVQYDAKLKFGEQKLKTKGIDGVVVKVYREIKGESDNQIRTDLISEDFYPPVHEVIVQSLITKVSEEPQKEINEIDTVEKSPAVTDQNSAADTTDQNSSAAADTTKNPNIETDRKEELEKGNVTSKSNNKNKEQHESKETDEVLCRKPNESIK